MTTSVLVPPEWLEAHLHDPAVRVVEVDVSRLAYIGAHRQAIVDVRSWDEYRGERFWPSGGPDPSGRAGHVPSAVHQPIDGLYDERGSFRAGPSPTCAPSSPASTWMARMS